MGPEGTGRPDVGLLTRSTADRKDRLTPTFSGASSLGQLAPSR
jgi:hypothetical protein